MSRENPDSSMDIACLKLIVDEMKPFKDQAVITLTFKELEDLLYGALESGYCQGAEDWYG